MSEVLFTNNTAVGNMERYHETILLKTGTSPMELHGKQAPEHQAGGVLYEGARNEQLRGAGSKGGGRARTVLRSPGSSRTYV